MTIMIETLDAEYEPPAQAHREAVPAAATDAGKPDAGAVAAAVERELWRAVRVLAD